MFAVGAGCGSSARQEHVQDQPQEDALCLPDGYYAANGYGAAVGMTPEGVTTPVTAQPPIEKLRAALIRDLPCSFTGLDYRIAGSPVVYLSPLTSTERDAMADIATTVPELNITVVSGRQSLAAAEAQRTSIHNALLRDFTFHSASEGINEDGQVTVEVAGLDPDTIEPMKQAIVGAALGTYGAHTVEPSVTVSAEFHGFP
ncbi:MAG: hypothetical protein QOE09_3670 [Ilumatobacteraceae bacterium]